jgi:hypothetical protein
MENNYSRLQELKRRGEADKAARKTLPRLAFVSSLKHMRG